MVEPEAYIVPSPLRVPIELEVALDVEPADRVAAGAAVLEQVLEQPVLGDVGLEAGAVDDEVDLDRHRALRGADVVDDPLAVAAPSRRRCRRSSWYQPSRRPCFICFCHSLRYGVFVPPIRL